MHEACDKFLKCNDTQAISRPALISRVCLRGGLDNYVLVTEKPTEHRQSRKRSIIGPSELVQRQVAGRSPDIDVPNATDFRDGTIT